MYNFLSLVNNVNERLNEVPLTSSNFATATGFYSQAKEAVNAAIREIDQDSFEWPWNHVTQELALTEGQVRYTNPAAAKSLNFDSFRVKGVPASNVRSTKLYQMDYEEFLDKYSDSEYNPERYQGIPTHVFRTPDFKFGLYPPPKDGLSIIYEYYRLPEELVDWDDVPFVPSQFKHIIVDGALQHAFMFRGDPESTAVMFEKFKVGLKNMRTIYQNRYEYMRSPTIVNTVRGRL